MLEIKCGDTLSYSGFLPVGSLPAGSWSTLCAVYDRKEKTKFDIQSTLTAPAGPELRYFLHLFASPAQTALWPARRLDCDIQFTDSSALPVPAVFSTKTFAVNVTQDVA